MDYENKKKKKKKKAKMYLSLIKNLLNATYCQHCPPV
jgi:hypothetical protein